MHIFMTEDNESVCEMLQMFFEKENWPVTFIHDGQEGLDEYENKQEMSDLLILDIMLHSGDGMTMLREVRKFDPQIRIIILTDKDRESDEVIGLELGADDYVTKPFSPLTLVARIKSTVRRVETPGEAVQTNSNYDIDTENL